MHKLITLCLLSSVVAFSVADNIPSTPIVTLVGGHIKGKDVPINKKYERKNCPVCKGTGKYLSGDGIKMVDCGYCEEPKSQTEISYTPLPENDFNKQAPSAGKARSTISVFVPVTDATIIINDKPTTITGLQREFICDGLEVNQYYDFKIKMSYIKNNESVQKVRVVKVLAGQSTSVIFE